MQNWFRYIAAIRGAWGRERKVDLRELDLLIVDYQEEGRVDVVQGGRKGRDKGLLPNKPLY